MKIGHDELVAAVEEVSRQRFAAVRVGRLFCTVVAVGGSGRVGHLLSHTAHQTCRCCPVAHLFVVVVVIIIIITFHLRVIVALAFGDLYSGWGRFAFVDERHGRRGALAFCLFLFGDGLVVVDANANGIVDGDAAAVGCRRRVDVALLVATVHSSVDEQAGDGGRVVACCCCCWGGKRVAQRDERVSLGVAHHLMIGQSFDATASRFAQVDNHRLLTYRLVYDDSRLVVAASCRICGRCRLLFARRSPLGEEIARVHWPTIC